MDDDTTTGRDLDRGDAIGTAQAFHDDDGDGYGTTELELRERQSDQAHGRVLARIWAPVVAVVLLAVLALFAFIVYAMTSEHAQEHRHQVHVWCYADPNNADATSEFVGSPDDVLGKCPDGRYYAPGQTSG